MNTYDKEDLCPWEEVECWSDVKVKRTPEPPGLIL